MNSYNRLLAINRLATKYLMSRDHLTTAVDRLSLSSAKTAPMAYQQVLHEMKEIEKVVEQIAQTVSQLPPDDSTHLVSSNSQKFLS